MSRLMQMLSIPAAIFLTAMGILFAIGGMTNIEPGEVGILVKMIGDDKGMQEETLDTGLHWVNPIVFDVPIYDTRLKQYVLENIETQTKDGQPVLVDVSLELGLLDKQVPWLHEHIGEDYWEEVVYPALRSAIRGKVPSRESDEVYTSEGREAIQNLIQEVMDTRMRPKGIQIVVNLRDIDFTNNAFVIRVENIAEGEKQKRIKAAEAQREELRLNGEGERLQQEERAKGILAVKSAEAEGARLLTEAYGDSGVVAQIEWAHSIGPDFQVWGVPTGAPGTSSLIDINGIIKNAFTGGGK